MLRLIRSLISLVFLYVGLSVIGMLIPYPTTHMEEVPTQTIYLTTNGVHAGFILKPYDHPKLETLWHAVDTLNMGNPYLLFGWGERDFYINTPAWSDLKAGTALQAILWPTPSALHVSVLKAAPLEYPETYAIRVSPAQLDQLVTYLVETAHRGPGGNVTVIPNHPYGPGNYFLESDRSYHAFRTCNTWAARGLQVAGLPAPLWSPFDVGVLWRIKNR